MRQVPIKDIKLKDKIAMMVDELKLCNEMHLLYYMASAVVSMHGHVMQRLEGVYRHFGIVPAKDNDGECFKQIRQALKAADYWMDKVNTDIICASFEDNGIKGTDSALHNCKLICWHLLNLFDISAEDGEKIAREFCELKHMGRFDANVYKRFSNETKEGE